MKNVPYCRWSDETAEYKCNRAYIAHLLRAYRKPAVAKTHEYKLVSAGQYALTSKYPGSPTLLIFTRG